MRVTATVPGYDAWIEFSEVWNRVDLRRVMELDGQKFLDFLANKTIACHLDTTEGEPITVPSDLSVRDSFERLDLRVIEFVAQALMTAAMEAQTSARSSFFCGPLSPPSETQPEPAAAP